MGDVELQIRKVREGSYFPSFLEPRRRPEQARLAVVQQACIEGVSTRKVDDLVQSLRLSGMDKSTVSRICKQRDAVVDAVRNRPLESDYPYVWLDALYLKVRVHGRVVSQALVMAIGVRRSGERDVLGLELGCAENRDFWLDFLRGLKGVQLVISDAHEGLKDALQQVFAAARWQRCRVHFMPNVLAYCHTARKLSSVPSAARFSPNPAGLRLNASGSSLLTRWPQAAQVLTDAREDVLAYRLFPAQHSTRIYSTNPLERVNKKVKRRTNVGGVFPDGDSAIRCTATVLQELDDEWQAGRRSFSLESMQKLYQHETLSYPLPQRDWLPFSRRSSDRAAFERCR